MSLPHTVILPRHCDESDMYQPPIVHDLQVTFVENSVMILLWYPHRTEGIWYNVPAMCVVWGGFFIGEYHTQSFQLQWLSAELMALLLYFVGFLSLI